MSEVTTMLAWLIPCIIIFLAVIAYRIYVYKTRGPFVPLALQRNVFARTRSFLPRTLSFSNKTVNGTSGPVESSTAPSTALRNETRIDMTLATIPQQSSNEQQQQQQQPSMTTISRPAPVANTNTETDASISKPPVSPAISRLLSMN
ncbi:hypothetical protein BGZ83_004563 [Gryganskiella cystojenkinii]|nr:hypothetical protein BGZ83_004563 [Gryganskiella cystojenkinii]